MGNEPSPPINFRDDIQDVISLPWGTILFFSFVFGLLTALVSFLAGIPGLIGLAAENYFQTGNVLGGESWFSLLLIFLLTVVLIAFSMTFLVTGWLLLNGSKTIQFLFLWTLVGVAYFCWIGIAFCVVCIPLVGFSAWVFTGDWSPAMIGVVFLYPAWKMGKGFWYSLKNFPAVANWVYRTVAETPLAHDP